MKRLMLAASVVGAAAVCGAADAAWMATPADALWNLTSLNWGAGAAWTDGNNALFGESATKEIEIAEDVAPASVFVTADGYTFGGTGTLALNGSFNVDEGLSATVSAPLAQTSGTLAGRFDKRGKGTLTLTGGGSFARLGATEGKLVLDGGTYNVVYPAGAEGKDGDKTPLYLRGNANYVMDVTGGAVLNLSGASVMKGAGRLNIVDGTLDASGLSFWNSAYTGVRTGRTTIGDGGTLIANDWLNAGFDDPDNIATLVTTGGTLRLLSASPLSGSSVNFKSTMLFDGGTLQITNSNFHTYRDKTFVKAGPGGLYLRVPRNLAPIDGFLSDGGETDGGLHPIGGPVLYMGGENRHRGGTWLDGTDCDTMFCIRSDAALGLVPDAPTSNIFFGASSVANILLTDSANLATHSNRTVCIAPGATARFGVASETTFTIGGEIHGPTDSVVTIVNNWHDNRRVVLNPGEGRTNSFGRLACYIDTVVGGGVTELSRTFTSSSTDVANNSIVIGEGALLSVTGGTLRTTCASPYLTLKGNLDVRGGVADFDSITSQILNAYGHSATVTVARAGTLVCKTFRLAQSISRDFPSRLYLATGGVLRANSLYIDTNNYKPSLPASGPYARIDFDGGILAPRVSNTTFTDASAQWLACVNAYALAGGMVVSNNSQVFFKLPLQSGAAQDGGVHKWGTGEFALVGTNTFNGPVVIHQGSFVFGRHDANFPQTATFNVRSNATLNANNQRQTIGRLEGGGRVIKATSLTVDGTIAPHGDDADDPVGTLSFETAATLAGDLVVNGNTNGCGCLKFNVAGIDISNLALKVPDVSALDQHHPSQHYRVVDAPSGFLGRFKSVEIPSPWQLVYTATSACVYFPRGTVITFR